eukprot:1510988-Alexandrium_andersonii.AAC.1
MGAQALDGSPHALDVPRSSDALVFDLGAMVEEGFAVNVVAVASMFWVDSCGRQQGGGRGEGGG